MGLNLESKQYYHFVDEYGMMLNRSDVDNGLHDSCERTCHAIMAYGDINQIFSNALISCIKIVDGKVQFQRHPKAYPGMKPMSRDHVYYIICGLIYAGRIDKAKEVASLVPFKIDKGTYQDLKMFFWLKLIQEKPIGKLFYPYEAVDLFIRTWLNVAIRKLFGITGEWYQGAFYELSVGDFSGCDVHSYKKTPAKLLFPTYALKINAFMLDVLPGNKFKNFVKNIVRPIIPEWNFLLQMLFDQDIPSINEINRYEPMTGDRWAQELNPQINNLNTKIITDESLLGENELDKDLILALYTNKLNSKPWKRPIEEYPSQN